MSGICTELALVDSDLDLVILHRDGRDVSKTERAMLRNHLRASSDICRGDEGHNRGS